MTYSYQIAGGGGYPIDYTSSKPSTQRNLKYKGAPSVSRPYELQVFNPDFYSWTDT